MPLDNQFIHGADRLKARITTIRERLALPLLTEEISQLLLARTLRRFDSEVDPDGRPWAPHAEATTATRLRRGAAGKKILVETGALRKAIRIVRGGAGTFAINTGAGVRIGIQDPEIALYARVQQRGWKAKRIPARRFLGIGALDVKAVDSLLRRKGEQIESLWGS